MPLTAAQVQRLLTPVRPDRIEKVRGQSYVPQFEARAELSRVFGFGNWDSHDPQRRVDLRGVGGPPQSEGDAPLLYWRVCYRAACTLTIRDYQGNVICSHTEWHAEESAPQPSRGEAHALALT